MTVHELLHLPPRQLLLTVHFLLLAAQMALLFHDFRDRRSREVRIPLAVHFLLSFGLFYLMMASILREHQYLAAPDQYPPLLAAFASLPAFLLILYEIFTAAVLLWAIFDLLRYRKEHPTFESIKETLDLLPVGIAFERKDGSTALHNLVMDHLAGKAQWPGARVVTLPDDASVWQISSEEVTVAGERFTQRTASDITQQSAITEELAKKNEKLRGIHLRLDIYNKQAERMIIAKELLTARMAVHNELGSILLESRHYLNEPSAISEEILLQALKNTNTYLLREYEQDDSAGDPLADALEMADAIGVEVIIDGIVPKEAPYRRILAAAITECATNTVKHADGDALQVVIREAGGTLSYTLCGNGKPPRGELMESGGLKSLRALIEKENGTMEIRPFPVFTVCISLPPA